jgi:predicted Fe-Mo cluster-binding NifX family protein
VAAQERDAEWASATEMLHRLILRRPDAEWVVDGATAKVMVEATDGVQAEAMVEATGGALEDLPGGSRRSGPRCKQAWRLRPEVGPRRPSTPMPIAKIWNSKLTGCATSFTKSRNASTPQKRNSNRSSLPPAGEGKRYAIRIRERESLMKIVVTAAGPSLDAAIDPRFGRCAYFVFVDTEDMSVEAIANESGAHSGGAGIQSAQLLAQRGVKAVLTGNCGPNAHQTLSAAGIDVIVGCAGNVSEAIERFKAGQLQTASAPNVANHSGVVGA